MPGSKKMLHSRSPRRRTRKRTTSSVLDQVREGVRRFILDEASIGEFHKALRSAGDRGDLSPNPLTGAAFRNIVRQVFDERKRVAKKRKRQ